MLVPIALLLSVLKVILPPWNISCVPFTNIVSQLILNFRNNSKNPSVFNRNLTKPTQKGHPSSKGSPNFAILSFSVRRKHASLGERYNFVWLETSVVGHTRMYRMSRFKLCASSARQVQARKFHKPVLPLTVMLLTSVVNYDV